ncbi:helix-turn-helix domain-containing protein [Streptomyces sp. NBC_01017]|uniref:telomere-associated protein Tap n=1 Tax=Streptomyces sp. NBC_01017 TaxID=2903721 RepID=UPI003866D938|nr:helix-turn-helix domain-containing protein [Streptomyces sp. NBC_01017]WSV35360.1 helix-turn-helix domain-containing protein [Streptomyces sp. NBC_01017]
MPTEEELIARAAELLARGPLLPPPAERKRLREAAGLTQQDVALALETKRETVNGWETGRTMPRPPRLAAYRHLLDGWAAQFPAPTDIASTTSSDTGAAAAVPETFTPAPSQRPRDVPAPSEPSAPPALTVTTKNTSRRPSTTRRPAKAAAPVVDPPFPNGPLAVLDGDGTAYCLGGVLLECPATTVPELVEWTLRESGLGAPKLNRFGKDGDPLIVLTAAAAVKLGLPERLEGHEQRRSLRLPEDHPVVKQVAKAKWQLTQRGFGPWARIYRKAQGRERQCVQLAILSWDALDERSWPGVAEMEPADIARVLGVYATRVITPRGSTAVSGLELMTALRPPTKAVQDPGSGTWVSGYNPGSLGTEPMDPAPPEATAEHPVVVNSGWTGGFLNEEAYQWVRSVDLLSDEECTLPFAVGLDLNTAFLAAAARLVVGLSAPDHFYAPTFNPKIPGSWLVDLSHIELDPRLPSPFTPDGTRPTGPAWYQTHTVAYAQELGFNVHPIEAYLRRETGAYLDPWHDRLKTAYVDTLADLGVTKDLDDRQFLAAMGQHKQVDPAMAAVLAAIKATVKGGVGKLRERPQGKSYKEGERWPALERPTWRPDIRAAVISKARVNMHRKLNNMVKMTGLYPLAVLSDCVVYPSPGGSPLGFLPYAASGKPQPGGFRLGPTPGLAKLEGFMSMLWAVDLMEQGLNPARHIKGGDAVLDEGE